jgi:hypothetical protein
MIVPHLLSDSVVLFPGPTDAARNTFLLPIPDPAPDGVATPHSDEKVPGNARANAAVAFLTLTATGRRTNKLFGVVDALQSSGAAFGFSRSGADDFTLGRSNVPGADLKRRALDQKGVVGALQGGFVPANVESRQIGGQIKAIQTVADEGSRAAEIKLAAGTKMVRETGVAVPEPGRWATLLAGLLGVIAIARRRMSL